VAEWSKAADCKSVRKLTLVRIQSFSIITNVNKNLKYKTFFKDIYFDTKNHVEAYSDNQMMFNLSNNPRVKTWKSPKPINTNFYSYSLYKYSFSDRGYNVHRRKFYNPTKTLALNFTRNRFFPTLRTVLGETYFFLSLGLLSKYLLKGKSFTKSKTVFILLASFLRKVLLFSSFKNLYLFINKTPLYFKEIMSTINDSVVNIYKNPFTDNLITEKDIPNPFNFPVIVFTNNKPYGFMKAKQKGRLKRKISRRLTVINKVLD
jgi:hypothetical protein